MTRTLFEPDYLECLLRKFSEDPKVGVAGTPFTEGGGYETAKDSFEDENHGAGDANSSAVNVLKISAGMFLILPVVLTRLRSQPPGCKAGERAPRCKNRSGRLDRGSSAVGYIAPASDLHRKQHNNQRPCNADL